MLFLKNVITEIIKWLHKKFNCQLVRLQEYFSDQVKKFEWIFKLLEK